MYLFVTTTRLRNTIVLLAHRIVIMTYHHLMLCRDCQESIASARCQDSITVILFQADISTHPLFLYRITLFECQLVTRDVQYWIAEEQYDWSLHLRIEWHCRNFSSLYPRKEWHYRNFSSLHLRKEWQLRNFSSLYFKKNTTVETLLNLVMFKKKAI